MFFSSLYGDGKDDTIEIVNIYSVHRAVEDSNYTHNISNKRLLFHSSAVQNFVGILSRLVAELHVHVYVITFIH